MYNRNGGQMFSKNYKEDDKMENKNNKENKDYYLPISSYSDYLKNMKGYLEYGIITYYSNFKQFDDYGNECLYRYIYENKLREKQEEIERISKKKFSTVMRNVRQLVKADSNLVTATNSPNGIVYIINYSTAPHGYFVTIHHEILGCLLDACSENALKLYVFLSYRCKEGATKITLKELAEAIGLSPNSKDTLQRITNITMVLNGKFIKKEYKWENAYDEKTKEIKNKKFCYYSIIPYEEFEEIRKREKGER